MSVTSHATEWIVALGAMHVDLEGTHRYDLLSGLVPSKEYYDERKRALDDEFGVTSERQAHAWLERCATTASVPEAITSGALFKRNRLFAQHRDALESAGFLAFEAHRMARFAALSGVWIGEDTVMMWMNVMAARVRRGYGSWRAYGFHVLLGDLAQDGVWHVELERSYVHLLEWDQSPWRRTPWDRYPVGERARSPLRVGVHIRCAACGDWVALHRLAPEVLCASCLGTIRISDDVWRSIRDGTRSAGPWPLGHENVEHTYDDDGEHSTEVAVAWPRCNRGHTLGERELVVGLETGFARCGVCAETIAIREPDAWLRSVIPGAKMIVGESDVGSAGSGARPISFCCMQCGAPLVATGENRVTTCVYCGSETRLDDELWIRLHPAPRDARLTLVVDTMK